MNTRNLMIGACLILSLTGCEDPVADRRAAPVVPPETAGRPAAPSSSGFDVRIGDVIADPAAHAGRIITVESRVAEVFTPWAFQLEKLDLLVIGADPGLVPMLDATASGASVRVSGTVRILQAEDFRRDYGRGVDDALFSRFEGKSVLVAHSVQKID